MRVRGRDGSDAREAKDSRSVSFKDERCGCMDELYREDGKERRNVRRLDGVRDGARGDECTAW